MFSRRTGKSLCPGLSGFFNTFTFFVVGGGVIILLGALLYPHFFGEEAIDADLFVDLTLISILLGLLLRQFLLTCRLRKTTQELKNQLDQVSALTARNTADAQASFLQERLHRTQKMEAVGRLAAGVAHDFNNILAAMLGYATFLVEDLPPDSPERGFAQQIQTAGERAKRLVQQLLAFSRSKDIEKKQANLAAVAEQASDLLRATAPKNVEIITQLRHDLPDISVNEAQILQLIMDLGLNAIDAIGKTGGRIILTVDEPPLEDITPTHVPAISFGTYDPLHSVRLRVTDTGSGIEAAHLERIFEPFFSTKPNASGLGLTAAHGVVMAHGGKISIESIAGQGSTVRVYLPTLPLVEDTVTPESFDVPALQGTERILLVEGEEQVLTFLMKGFERFGYDVAGCISAHEALEALHEDATAFDVVIVDNTMPDIAGIEFAQTLKQRGNTIPIILIASTIFELSDSGKALVHHILQKPVDLTKAVAVIRQIFDSPPQSPAKTP